MFKKRLISILWILLGIAAIGLLFIGAKNKGEKTCKGINVEVTENTKQVYTDEEGIKILIGENGAKVGMPMNQINLRDIENEIKKDAWIKDAKLYFDDNQILQVELKENDPIARIFTVNNNSFYIDSAAHFLPTDRNVMARVPVFTGFTSDKEKLSSPDSALLQQVKQLAQFIIKDSIWIAYASQINILPDATFEIIPVVGNATIFIGNADNLADKFNRLYSFYKQVLNRTGINKYSSIDVQYNGQVVASNDTSSAKPITVGISSDSLQTKLDNAILKQDTLSQQVEDTVASINNNILDTLPKATKVSPNLSDTEQQHATYLPHKHYKTNLHTTKNHNRK